ncbi:protein Wnt-7b-like [Tachypleus tridentatus]|uniref:protein Wnt-7b-like n=1 Tax=Tachypleus tridentatus TaxID=6853 RepID=UPI003FD6949B
MKIYGTSIVVWIICIQCLVPVLKQVSGSWMYLAMIGISKSELESQQDSMIGQSSEMTACSSVPDLVPKQIKVCQEHPGTIHAVSAGAKLGILECQHQFRYERWNCTPEGGYNVFEHTLKRGSKEAAFIHAIFSAGVVQALTESCSSGNLTVCACDRSQHGYTTAADGWKWGGCSDNVRYGISFARLFVDATEKTPHKTAAEDSSQSENDKKRKRKRRMQHLKAMMNLHNNHVGRLAVSKHMQLKCRCHGVSGSCELKTCWRKLPSFHEVGRHLKQKYEESVRVRKGRRKLRRRDKRRPKVRKHDLVHINRSPNFCLQDRKNGILGTTGRQCNKTSKNADGCDLLCCGRGYNTQLIRHSERCRCKFHWCCNVSCDICVTDVEIYTCK